MTSFASGTSFVQEDLSLVERLWRVLFAPRRSFSAVRDQEKATDWLVPVLITCAVGVLAHFATVGRITDLASPEVQQALRTMGEEQREQYLRSLEMLRVHGWLMVPVGVFSSLVLVSAVLRWLSRALFSVEASFRQMLVLKAYASLVLVCEWIVRVPLMLITGHPDVSLGPGAFLGQVSDPGVGERVLRAINVFDLWQIWILAIGMAVVGDASARKAGAALTVLWLMWIVGGAMVETLGAAVPSPPAG